MSTKAFYKDGFFWVALVNLLLGILARHVPAIWQADIQMVIHFLATVAIFGARQYLNQKLGFKDSP